MSVCSIAGCVNTLATNTRLKTCKSCRQSLHQLERRRPAYIVERNDKLHKYQSRLDTIATIKEGVATLIDRDTLIEEGVMFFKKPRPRSRRKA
jgi:hypothetical protein